MTVTAKKDSGVEKRRLSSLTCLSVLTFHIPLD